MLGVAGEDEGSHHDGSQHGFDNMQTFGILNALKTGDSRTDMVIAMLIPILMRFAFNWLSQLQKFLTVRNLRRWFFPEKEVYRRWIVHRSQRTYWGTTSSLDEDTQNTVLVKAIHLFLHQKCNLELISANIDLTSMEDKSGSSHYDYYYNDDDDDDEGSSRKTVVGMLSKYKIVQKPPHNRWHDVGKFGPAGEEETVNLIIEEDEEEDKDGNKNGKCTLSLQLTSSGKAAVDNFIETAYNWYIDQLRKMEDNSRYMYELKGTTASSSSSDEDGRQSGMTYSRYKLSDEKTFQSLFFQEKKPLLKLVDHFQNKTGKYSVLGYPHKLGLLLHGPPGTGKTSLIKALAQYTGRSIVNVSLSKISSNEELMNVFFDHRYYIQGENVPVKLGFKDVIFVMEDVDAASKVVKRRTPLPTGTEEEGELATTIQAENIPEPKSMWTMLLESNNSNCRSLVEKLMEKSERLKAEATKTGALLGLSRRMMALPALGLVGESDADIARLGDDACKSANDLMSSWETVDRFLGATAQGLCKLIDSGAVVSKELEDALLGQRALAETTVLRSNVTSSPPAEPNLQEAPLAAATGDHADVLMAALRSGFLDSKGGFGSESPASNRKKEAKTGTWNGGSSLWKSSKDSLNLSGLLNVLDGVVDSPGRIVIMTTNHPESLDPALIRPGRIDKKLMLGYMAPDDVVSMVEHYFQTTLDEAQRRGIELVAERLDLTPAQIEQFTAEYDELDDLFVGLEDMC